MKIRTGDFVRILAGKDKGKQGKVLRVLATKNRVVVEGANMRIRHIKKTVNQAGSRVTFEASLHLSNVSIIDPKTKKPTRVGYKIDEKGRKFRMARASGEIIKAAAVTTAKEAPAKKGSSKDKKEEKDVATGAAPTKQPFWKRAFSADSGEAEQGEKNSNTTDNHPVQALHRTQRESNG
jgi:large subunit ribosomal protein L24